MPRPKGSRNKPKVPTDGRGLIDPAAAHEQAASEAREHYARLSGAGTADVRPIRIGDHVSVRLPAAIEVPDPSKVLMRPMNGALPRSERNCANCDASRLVGRELRCWVEPPVPQVAGWLPPLDEGGVGRPIVLALQRPTFPEYVCPRWAVMQADHPDFGATSEAEASPAPVESRH